MTTTGVGQANHSISDPKLGADGSGESAAKRPGAAPAQEKDAASHPAVAWEYCLSLAAGLTQRVVGEIQGGWRIDLDYNGTGFKSVVAGPSLDPSTREKLVGASVVSGSDWAFVSTDATVDFDARVTIKLVGGANTAYFIAGRIRGRADLRECRSKDDARLFDRAADAQKVLTAWQAGFGQGSYLPLTMGVSIDVPHKGFDDKETQCYQACRELGRTLFLGRGQVFFDAGVNGVPVKLELHLFRRGGQLGLQVPTRMYDAGSLEEKKS